MPIFNAALLNSVALVNFDDLSEVRSHIVSTLAGSSL